MKPIDVKCSECGAQPGEKCKNYKDQNCDFHGNRLLLARYKSCTHSYVARKKCGCAVAVCLDMEDKDTAKTVAGFIRDGLHVDRVAFGTPEYTQIIEGLGRNCPPAKEPKQTLFAF